MPTMLKMKAAKKRGPYSRSIASGLTKTNRMPIAMQAIGYLMPVTHFMEIIRGIVLRGATLVDLLPEVLTLAVMGLVLLILSVAR